MQRFLKKSTSIFFIFFLLPFFPAPAQSLFRPVQDIPLVGAVETPLPMPWAGGLNTALLQMADLSGDGREELIALDRSSQSLVVYSWDNGQWQSNQELACLLPPGLSNWFLMQDYDGNGLKDIFTFTPAGIRVFRNTTAPGQPAEWELVEEGLNYQTTQAEVNLLVNSSDVPAIADVDGDGDLDILAYDPSGGGGLEYYRNTSTEETGTPGLQPFIKESRRWGGLSECACGVFAFNNEPCSNKRVGSRQLHTGGKSLLLFDVDADGDLDLLNGFEDCTELYYLENTGNNTEPLFQSVQTSLPGAGVETGMAYPAAFIIQQPEGQSRQLAVSSQLSRNKFKEDFSQSVWLYGITEEADGRSYQLKTEAFLQESMLDVGEAAVPAFMDLDADGDLDMLLGSFGLPAEEGFYGSLWMYENTGTAAAPSFLFKTSDYLDLRANNFLGISPQFIDFNRDGNTDLLLVATEPERLQRKAYLLLNQAGANEAPRFTPEQIEEIPLSLSAEDSPTFYDVSGDGLPDLLLGSFDGSLRYYLNSGTAESPQFELQSSAYLGLGLDNYRRPLIPSVGDLTGNGRADLLLADGTGSLRYLPDFSEYPEDAKPEPVTVAFCEDERPGGWLGRRSWPVAVPLRDQEAPMLVIGNQMGGLWLVEQQGLTVQPGGEELQLLVYPNPLAFPLEQVNIRTNYPAHLRLFTLSGQLVLETSIQANRKLSLHTEKLAEGMYLLQAQGTAGSKTQRLILLK